MKIKSVLEFGIQKLNEYKIEEASSKARTLLSYILKKDKIYLVINGDEEVNCFEEYSIYIAKIIGGYPIQYITNKQEFMGLEFYVDENVLVPQPDTEILVEECKEYIKNVLKNKSSIKILDICCGSGAIGISIAKFLKNMNIENTYVYCSDISDAAIQITKKNAKQNNVEIGFIKSNMFDGINENIKFDIIISNPPYIETNIIKTLSKEVRNEPHIALDGGLDGLDFYKTISNNGYKYLNKEGKMFLEIGYDQKEKVIYILEKQGKYINIWCTKDYGGNDRVISCNFM